MVVVEVVVDAVCIMWYSSSGSEELVDAGDMELLGEPSEFNELWLCVGDILL